jgi:hypothetical protein
MGTGSTDFVYGAGRKALNTGQVDWLTAAVNAMLVSAVYSPQPNTDKFVSDISSAAILIRDAALTSKGITSAGVCFGTIPPYNSLALAAPAVGVILYVLAESDGASQLLYYSSTGSGFPFLAQGFNYVIGYDQSNGGYFQ